MKSVQGRNGTVVFDGKSVRIERSGLLAKATHGSGTKVWPLGQIGSIQLVKPGFAGQGYFQISAAGDTPVKSQKANAKVAADENAVIVTKKMYPNFEALRDEIIAAL